MRITLLALTCTFSFCHFSSLAEAAEEGPLNVLFISIDDLNDWTSILGGHPQSFTPNFDRLAESGMLFRNAHCAAPACNPSRTAVMTGIRPSTSGIYYNADPWRKSEVLADTKTITQWFRDQGYRVYGSGKIFHGSFPDPKSWDSYWPSQTKTKPSDPKPKKLPVNGIPKTAHFDWGPHPEKFNEMGDWQVAEWISKELGKEQEKPFFLACGFYRPHLPWYAPQEYFDRFPVEEIVLPDVKDNDLDDIPPAGIKMARPDGDHAEIMKHVQWKEAVQGYLASISFVDDCLGRVIDALEAGPHSDRTIVVLWSDHGWHLGEKEHWRKFALWENTTHVPLILRTPGMTTAGQSTEAPVNLLDLYPTLVDLAGLPANSAVEGRSLRPLLENTDPTWNYPSLTTHGRGNHSVRDNRWRYIRYADGSEELYDHERDSQEYQNLAGDPKLAREKERLAKFLPEEEAPERRKK